ncbi:uncharacterized protein LOC119996560 [Tripterygium wilfordii]|uniref:uncharacterized protein LOC119996560 n=1 Tax=Tripterygium wilfordii TaxID=458696 RepID=UPI0018F80A4B|nr:uncharacterized protein LOC119996560 [Tripterygium wilfordii]
MEIQHYSHQHKLTFLGSEDQTDGGERIYCHLCYEPITAASYNCRECNYSLHESCAKLNDKIWHRFHRQHRLTLCLGPGTCHICAINNYRENNLMYVCDDCDFGVDVKCASLSSKCDHPHQFVLLMRSEAIRCDVCGIDCDLADSVSQPHICTVCHLVVHANCISTPQGISLRQHRHPLVHACVIQESEGVKSQCRICRDEVSTIYGCYYCSEPECNFVVHVNCALQNEDHAVQNPVGDQDEDQLLILPKHNYSDMVLSFRNLKPFQPPWSKKIKPEEEDHKVPEEIKHFSHPHNLTLSDDEIDVHNNKYYCDGCILPISNPFYSCAECDFLLHETCLQLPTFVYPLDGSDIFTLKAWRDNGGIFFCSACHNQSHGFIYKSNAFGTEICIRCVSVPQKFKHAGHEHILPLIQRTKFPCNACGSLEKWLSFGCPECLFGLCYKCATLPGTIKHSSFGDQYVLTYHDSIDNAYGDGEYYCDLCEKARDPMHWCYYCAEIDYRAHPKCALGKYPYLKPGREYHLYPFSSVLERSSEHKLCATCSAFCKLTLPPKKIVESFHEHAIHLAHKSSFKESSIEFFCDACLDQIIEEQLFYRCWQCGFCGHLKCVLGDAFIENALHHKGRILTFVQMTRNDLPCISCGEDCEDLSLACPNTECSFLIHYDCRTNLPWPL